MANQNHLDILKQGAEIWNRWREEQTNIRPNLSQAFLRKAELSEVNFSTTNLSQANLNEADLFGADFSRAKLRDSYLTRADFRGANLDGADLSQANLNEADFRGADLSGANLKGTQIYGTDFSKANWSGANFGKAILVLITHSESRKSVTNEREADEATAHHYTAATTFGDVDLSMVEGLNKVYHFGPSIIDINTIYRSQGKISEIFLRKAGVPVTFLTYMQSLIIKPIDYYTCFISYSSKDEGFVQRLYNDLQASGVRCWFAPEDMKIGDRIRPRIDESIRIYDKLLLVLTEHSVASKWVEFEVEAALDKEHEGKPPVLFPVRLDTAVMENTTAWATHIKRTQHIGDFTEWKNHDAYQKAFTRLLRDLKPGD